MGLFLILVTLSSALALETFTEKRDIADAAGKKFSCTYKIAYDAATPKVNKAKSSVKCKPNKNGKATKEDFFIEAIGKTATVSFTLKKNKYVPSKISVVEASPATPMAPPATGGAMDCTCRPNRTAIMEEWNQAVAEMAATGGQPAGRTIRFLKKVDERGINIKPLPIVSTRGGGSSLYTTLITPIINALVGQVLAGLVPVPVLFRSLPEN